MTLQCPNCGSVLSLNLAVGEPQRDVNPSQIDLNAASTTPQNGVKSPQNGVNLGVDADLREGVSSSTKAFSSKSSSKNKYSLNADFLAFWAAYPRKVGKGAAFRRWLIATRYAEPDAIIVAARDFARVCSGVEQRFIPHPATWLNAARWDDEVQLPPAVGETDPAYTIGTPEYAARQEAEEDAAIAALGDA